MKEKFEKYLNKVFKKVKNTPEVINLKEEIMSDLLEKSEEMKKYNLDDDKTNSEGEIWIYIAYGRC